MLLHFRIQQKYVVDNFLAIQHEYTEESVSHPIFSVIFQFQSGIIFGCESPFLFFNLTSFQSHF